MAGSFSSRFVDGPVGYTIWRPHDVARSAPLPVIVSLPGRGGDSSWVFDVLGLHRRLASVMRRGSLRAALASVDGGDTYWHERVGGENRLAMLLQEFVPLLERQHHLGARGRALTGLSMGGYGALLAAERNPGFWAGVAVASPAIWPSYTDVWVADAFDGSADFARHDVFGRAGRLRGMPVWVGCGTEDPFYPAASQFAEAVGARTDWRSGGHDTPLWRSIATQQVAFALHSLRRV
ncbi:MAG TPA: alpha/beta hydrolase-fold protein [Gaiellales bacterium]|nr:alpha/beta hydrolase-fold protein [Gaiellales bacterium]